MAEPGNPNALQDRHRCGIVAIIGPPNAGKSTLLNHFLGEKLAIVTPKPQTTRNQISGILSRDEAQIIFLDTPGIHYSRQTLNSFLVETAWQALESADAILFILDASRYRTSFRLLQRDLESFRKRLGSASLPVVVGLNKIDLVREKPSLLPIMETVSDFATAKDIHLLSAAQGTGTSELLEGMIRLLPHSPPLFPPDQLSNLPQHFLASEIIREKLFLSLQQELPYATAVSIERWQELPEEGRVFISGLIYVTKANHKKMIIGRKGQNLKSIGVAARQELELMLEMPVHLELWVKVKPGWTEDRRFLLQLSPQESL